MLGKLVLLAAFCAWSASMLGNLSDYLQVSKSSAATETYDHHRFDSVVLRSIGLY